MEKYELGDRVDVLYIKPLEGKDVAPPLELGEEYTVSGIAVDSKGNQHLDVGLYSEFNYITSFETGEVLPDLNVHWCHPSRFRKIK